MQMRRPIRKSRNDEVVEDRPPNPAPPLNLQLTDKTALISGSTKGIGFAIAAGLAREGARVILNGRTEQAVADAKKQITAAVPNAKAETFAGDLATPSAAAALL